MLLFLSAALQMKFALHRKMCKVIKSSAFWDTAPCILVKINRLLRETYCVHLHGQLSFAACFILVSSLAYSSSLTMEVISSSETSVDFQRSTQCCSPEKHSSLLKSELYWGPLDSLFVNSNCQTMKRHVCWIFSVFTFGWDTTFWKIVLHLLSRNRMTPTSWIH
jgi:hypothetical protein